MTKSVQKMPLFTIVQVLADTLTQHYRNFYTKLCREYTGPIIASLLWVLSTLKQKIIHSHSLGALDFWEQSKLAIWRQLLLSKGRGIANY